VLLSQGSPGSWRARGSAGGGDFAAFATVLRGDEFWRIREASFSGPKLLGGDLLAAFVGYDALCP
jgi:hypothetical protein